MKKLIFTLLSVGLLYGNSNGQACGNSNPSGPSQCTPSGTMAEPGLSPKSDSLPSVVNGVASTTVIQFKNYDTARYNGLLVTVQSLQIDQINNLPAGLCWSTNKTNNTYTNQEDGCIKINGTTCADPGVYKLAITVKADIGFGAIPINAEDVGLYYFVRVINSGDSEVPLDTTQTAAFSKPAGYSASATGCTGLETLNNIKATLSIVPNPFNTSAVVTFTSFESGLMTEKLTNLIGSEVINRKKNVMVGQNTSVIDRNDLPAGVYFYSLSDGKNLITKRVVIE